jgi:hypothetical protein
MENIDVWGTSVAIFESNTVFVGLLRFELTLIDPSAVWDTRYFGPHLQNNMWGAVRRRTKDGTSDRIVLWSIGMRIVGPCIFLQAAA